MIKINYFDESELLVRREIETKAPKPKAPKCYPSLTTYVTSILIYVVTMNCIVSMNQTSSNASFQTLLQMIVHQTLISISNQIFFSFLPLCGLPPPSTRFSRLVTYKENLVRLVETYDPMLFLKFLA